MICAGLDVGSRTIKLVLFDGSIRESSIVNTGANPLTRCRELLAGKAYERMVLTGSGGAAWNRRVGQAGRPC